MVAKGLEVEGLYLVILAGLVSLMAMLLLVYLILIGLKMMVPVILLPGMA